MMSRKKIFRLFSRLNIGGPSLHVVNLALGLEPYGYDTTLIVGKSSESEGSLDEFARAAGANILVIETFQASLSPMKDLKTLVILTKLFWRERPDIVHTHTFKAGLLGRLAAWIARVPIVVHTYHGHLLSGYGRSGLGTALLNQAERWLGKTATRLVAVSQQVAADLVRARIAPGAKFDVVELGFDMKTLQSNIDRAQTLKSELGIPSDSKIVAIVGRLVSVKSVDLFLEALIPLLSSRLDLHLAVIGDGSERAMLEQKSRSLANVDTLSRIHFTGWRLPASADLRSIDVCVCSSKNEGTSVSIIEAVVAEVPVVSTRVGGMSDLLEGGRWGKLVNYDANELRESVRETLDQPPDASHLRLASQVFRQRFSNERLSNEIAAIYEIGVLV